MGLGSRHNQHSFAQIPTVNAPRSAFDRSFTVKDTFDFDYLVPIFVDEILPGDTCNLNVKSFGRLATQIVPIMDNMYIDFFFFFVPNRLVWTNWEKFNGAQDDPGDSTDFTIPQMTMPVGGSGNEVDSLFDKFGIPTGIHTFSINALPARCYNLIWNEWFRSQDLQDRRVVDKDDGPDAYAHYATLAKRNKRHDYFTSCLPWPQKGDSVTFPIGTTAPVYGTGKALGLSDGTNNLGLLAASPATSAGLSTGEYNQNIGHTWVGGGGGTANRAVGVVTTGVSGLYADLASTSGASINQLREAWLMQSLLELDARGGTRYVEILQNHFNVTSPDFRLQRPEYLGGGSTTINSHPVAQNSPTSGANAQGQLAAFATTSTQGQNIGFTKSFVEHGYVIGLACARADITYQQGLNKMWSRSTRWDFFWPKLQELGEQAVLNKEIYLQSGVVAANDEVFGYQERHAEYRYKPSEIHGKFRSTYATPLDMWHLAEEFGSLPALNDTFIQQNTPIERAIAVDTEPDLIMDCWMQYRHTRPMMTYSVPATIGRF